MLDQEKALDQRFVSALIGHPQLEKLFSNEPNSFETELPWPPNNPSGLRKINPEDWQNFFKTLDPESIEDIKKTVIELTEVRTKKEALLNRPRPTRQEKRTTQISNMIEEARGYIIESISKGLSQGQLSNAQVNLIEK